MLIEYDNMDNEVFSTDHDDANYALIGSDQREEI